MQELERYKKVKLTIDYVWANVFGILILIPLGLIFWLPFYVVVNVRTTIHELDEFKL
jgi:hypothetical protein